MDVRDANEDVCAPPVEALERAYSRYAEIPCWSISRPINSPSFETRRMPNAFSASGHRHRSYECGRANDETADELRFKHFHAAAVEQACKGIVRMNDNRGYSEGLDPAAEY
jgi:hypothetical protein